MAFVTVFNNTDSPVWYDSVAHLLGGGEYGTVNPVLADAADDINAGRLAIITDPGGDLSGLSSAMRQAILATRAANGAGPPPAAPPSLSPIYSYAGTWQADTQYLKGQFVSRRRGVFLAANDVLSGSTFNFGNWREVVPADDAPVYDLERDLGAPTDGVSDATAAFQAAANLLTTVDSIRVKCAAKTYNVGQINWPSVPLTAATPTLEFVGGLVLQTVPFCPGTGGDSWSVPAVRDGTIIKPTMTTGPGFGGNLSGVSNIHVVFRDIIVRCPPTPPWHGIDAGWLLNLTCIRVMVDVGLPTGKTGGIPQPQAGVYGVIFPGEGNGGVAIARDLTVQGFGVGIQFSEHFDGDRVTVFKNLVGLEPRDGWHAARMGRVNLYWNTVGIQPKVYNATHPTTRLNIVELDSEETDEASAWYKTTQQISDPGNRLRGRVRHHRMKAATGINGALLRLGAAYLDLSPLGGFDGLVQDIIGFEGSNSTTVPATSLGGAPPQALRGVWGINGQQLYISTVSGGPLGDLCVWDTGTAQVLIHAQVKVPTTIGFTNLGLALCAVDASNYLCAQIAAGSYSIQKVDTGTFTNLSGNLTGITMVASQMIDLKVTLQGKRIRMYADGVLVRSYTLSGPEWTKYSAGTSHGAWAYTQGFENGTGRWDFIRVETPVPFAA